MMTVREGKYSAIRAAICTQGKRRVDVDAVYDRNAYRPSITSISGKPMFLS